MRSVTVSDFPQCCGIKILHSFYRRLPTAEYYGSIDYINLNIKNYVEQAQSLIKENAYKEAIEYLGYTISAQDQIKYPNGETIDEWRERIKKEVKDHIGNYWRAKVGFIAILNSSEIPHIESILLELGFTILIPNTYNPSGTQITTYWFDLNPKNKEETKPLF